jgi:VWFA-related protein
VGELAAFEANRPGRKIVIWVSPGWPLLSGPNVELTNKDQQGIFNTIVGLSTQLRQSAITLYSLDPLGTDESLGRENYYQGYIKGVRTKNQVMFADLALQVLAYQSGGRVINASNDLAGEMEKCVRDASAYYVLSFAAVPADGPDDYHAIEVKIAQPGIKAQTRTGYYAQPGTRP